MRKEKHFAVVEVDIAQDGSITRCTMEAIRSNRLMQIDWRELKDGSRWLLGWK